MKFLIDQFNIFLKKYLKLRANSNKFREVRMSLFKTLSIPLIFLFVSCAANNIKYATESETKEALIMSVPDGMARLYFYRVDDISGLAEGSDPLVIVDGVEIIKLPNRTFSYLDVKSSEHTVKLKLMNSNQKEIVTTKLNAGEIQYIKASASGALGAASLIVTAALFGPVVLTAFKMSVVEKSLALDELQKLRLVKVKSNESGSRAN